MENDLDGEINVVDNNNTGNEDHETKLKFLLEKTKEMPSWEYRPGLNELKENKIICTIWGKNIRLNDFITGSKELREKVIQKLEDKINQNEKVIQKLEDKINQNEKAIQELKNKINQNETETIGKIIEILKTKKENESL